MSAPVSATVRVDGILGTAVVVVDATTIDWSAASAVAPLTTAANNTAKAIIATMDGLKKLSDGAIDRPPGEAPGYPSRCGLKDRALRPLRRSRETEAPTLH